MLPSRRTSHGCCRVPRHWVIGAWKQPPWRQAATIKPTTSTVCGTPRQPTLRSAVALARECGDDKRQCTASLSLVDMLWTTDRRAEAEPLAREALALVATLHD